MQDIIPRLEDVNKRNAQWEGTRLDPDRMVGDAKDQSKLDDIQGQQH